MRTRLIGIALGLCLAATLAGASAASAYPGPTLKARVVGVRCEANRTAMVTLAATSNTAVFEADTYMP